MTIELHRLTAYFGERARHDRRFVADALLDTGAVPCRSVVVLRGAAGFGPRHEIRTDVTLSQSEDLPVAVVAVDTADRIAAFADRAAQVLPRGTLAVERVRRAGGPVPPAAEHVELTVHTGRTQRVDGRPAHVAVCDALHRHGFTSATSFLGVDGIVGESRCRAGFFGRNASVPVVTTGVGPTSAATDAARLLVDPLPSALMTVAPVRLYRRNGVTVNHLDDMPGTDADGLALWRKVTIHTFETDLHHGRPVHREVLRRLRESPTTAGVTVLRGVWGFVGDAEPQGDKLFQIGRHVPVTTQYIDRPDRIAASLDLVDEVTRGAGVVTLGTVPAVVSVDGGVRRGGTRLASTPDM